MLYDETQRLLQMYFLLEYWANEYKKFRTDVKQRLELKFSDAIENPSVIAGLVYLDRRERIGKNDKRLAKDAVVYKYPTQNLDVSDGWNDGSSVHFFTVDGEIRQVRIADFDYA